MKKLLIPAMLVVAATSYGALVPATNGRLIDYTNWFTTEFNVSSDDNYTGIPYPTDNQPGPFTDANRDWSGWTPNWSAGLVGPFAGNADGLVVEALFLGETAGWWNDWGYRFNGVDNMLADGVQTVGSNANIVFGDYTYFTLYEGDTLDFFVTGSEIKKQDGGITVGGTIGGKYYVFDKSLNTPVTADKQSYFGTLTPLSSVRGPQYLGDEDGTIPFTVMALEDINIRSGASDKDFNDFLFAFRAGDLVQEAPVPEPSTYGLIGAAALFALVGYRRFKKKV